MTMINKNTNDKTPYTIETHLSHLISISVYYTNKWLGPKFILKMHIIKYLICQHTYIINNFI